MVNCWLFGQTVNQSQPLCFAILNLILMASTSILDPMSLHVASWSRKFHFLQNGPNQVIPCICLAKPSPTCILPCYNKEHYTYQATNPNITKQFLSLIYNMTNNLQRFTKTWANHMISCYKSIQEPCPTAVDKPTMPCNLTMICCINTHLAWTYSHALHPHIMTCTLIIIIQYIHISTFQSNNIPSHSWKHNNWFLLINHYIQSRI